MVGKHLKLGSDPKNATWSLAEDADLDDIRARLAVAMDEGTSVGITVKLGQEETAELLVNGRVVSAAVVWEEEEPRRSPGFTMID
jgi:hypothetical protein